MIVIIYYLACSVIPEYSYQSFHYLTRVSASHIIFPRMFRMTDGHFMHFISTRDRNSYSVMSFQSLTRTQHGRSMLTISALKQCSNTLPAALDNIVFHPTFLPYNSSCILHIIYRCESCSTYHLRLHSHEKLQTFLMQYLQCIMVQHLSSS